MTFTPPPAPPPKGLPALLVAKSEETIVDEFLEEYEEAQPVLPQPKEEKSSALDTYDSWAEALEDW